MRIQFLMLAEQALLLTEPSSQAQDDSFDIIFFCFCIVSEMLTRRYLACLKAMCSMPHVYCKLTVLHFLLQKG